MPPSVASALDEIPRSARAHFRLHAYAAVLRLIQALHRLLAGDNEDLDPIFARFPFLSGYFAELCRYMPQGVLWNEAPAWWQSQIDAWAGESSEPLPLRALREEGQISFTGISVLMLVGMVEEDSRFGTLFTELQPTLVHRRPSLELVGRMAGSDPVTTGEDGWSLCQPLLAAGLLDVANREVPRSEWELSVPAELWDAMRGESAATAPGWFRHHALADLPQLADLILPPPVLEHLAELPALVHDGTVRAIVLRGLRGSEEMAALGAVARLLGRGVIEVEGPELTTDRRRERLGPLCLLTRSLPALRYELGLGETAQLPDLNGYRGATGILLGPEGGFRGGPSARALTVHLPLPDPALRRRYWLQALAGRPCPDLDAVSRRFQMPGGYIRQAGAMAVARAALERREAVRLDDIQEACRSLNRQALDTLAVRLEARGTWPQLVVSEPTMDKLKELEQRCRHRERLLAHLSPAYASGTNRGVRALFSGQSGTGKTLAARILAAELGMDIYRVDLAAVVNKYIGETEKNLNQVLARAEELDVILLLDEGDSLLAKRSDVNSANDRYANLETNYLLQRLEGYQGIVLVTTNAGEYIDKAFQRRMDVSVDFLPPRAEERLRIWELHLPPAHQVTPSFLEEIAIRCLLTGGQIRNAALHATLLALDSGNLSGSELATAIRSEYRKAGAVCPLDEMTTEGWRRRDMEG